MAPRSAPMRIPMLESMDFFALLDHFREVMEPYQVPMQETPDERDLRISRTLDEMPDVFGWFIQVHGYFDWLTDRYKELHGQSSPLYKEARQKRDAAERVCSLAKLRYQGTSRLITRLMDEEEQSGMPRGRKPR